MPSSVCRIVASLMAVTLGLVSLAMYFGDSPGYTKPKVTDAIFPQHDVEGQASFARSTLLAQSDTANRTYTKWLWWPLLAYLFWGMAYVCDEYFVRTIQVMSERFRIPDDVAGATLMALGCNGPEMALNTISIFNPSDIGVGAVIGGEVFNVLVIIGAAMLATPDAYLPLRISNFSFFRDVLFYIVSVLMLYAVLRDGEISRKESLSLLCGAVVYSTTVAASSMIREQCYKLKRCLLAKWRPATDALTLDEDLRNPGEARATLRQTNPRTTHRSSGIAEVLNGPRRTNASSWPPQTESVGSIGDGVLYDSDFENEADEELIAAWDEARGHTDPCVGSVLKVKVEVRSRMMDRVSRAHERYMWLTDNALMVSAAVDPEFPSQQKGRSCGMIYDVVSGWHHGGLVNAPDTCDGEKLGVSGVVEANNSTDALLRASKVPSKAGILGLHEVPCEIIPLKNILYCDPVEGNPNFFTLHIHQQKPGGLGRLITLELQTKHGSVHDSWILALQQHLQNQPLQLRQTADCPPPPETCKSLLRAWVHWLQFPVESLVKISIPDMDRPELQKWYPVAFVMSMAWLAGFAYLVVSACDGIHADFGIPNALLGFTIAAAGTSFPNVFSGMVVSRQGKTTMAIANALGANVQNVFLALAVPWTIQSCFITHGPFPMPVSGLEAQIAAIFITLAPVVVIFLCSSCTMPKWSGYVYLGTYALYLIVALGQQSTGCTTWPLGCK
jgi:K+-dependent Na+/Ca+ exchanger-like protein